MKLLLASLLALLGICAFAQNTVTVTEGDGNTQVTLKPGDTLVVQLNANPSTGYSWQIVQNNPFLLPQIGKGRFQGGDSGMMGAPGKMVFRFRAANAGGEALRMVYLRPFASGGIPPADTFQLLVVIDRPQSKTVTLRDNDNNGRCTLDVGDILVVQLTSNASTGYSWSVAQSDDGLLQPIGSRYIRGRGMPGAPGKQEFRFRVIGSGGTWLRFLYQKPGQGGVEAAQRWENLITINRPGGNGGLLGSGG